MKKRPGGKKRINFFIILLILPILFLGLLIIIDSVNVPLLDQWEMVPILQHIRAGHLVLTDFWWQHNEHRVLIPYIVLTTSAVLTHWNTVVEVFIGFVVSIASFVTLLKMFRRTSSNTLNRKLSLWLPILLSVIWFSPVQVENWLWGWQIEWFLNVLGAVLVAYALTGVKNRKMPPRYLLLLLAGGLLAQYSLGNGTLLWPLAVAALLYLRVPIAKLGIVAATGIISTAVYFRHYIIPGYPSKSLFIKEPVIFVKYVFIYLGRPLTFLRTGAEVAGALMVALFIWLVLYIFTRRRESVGRAIPWMLLGGYAIGSAIITAISRMGLGLSQAYSSRYTTISMLLLVSLMMIISLVSADLLKFFNASSRKLFLAGAATIFALLIFSNAAWGVHSASEHHSQLISIKKCTSLKNPTTTCFLSTYPNPGIVKSRLDYLKQIHWGGY